MVMCDGCGERKCSYCNPRTPKEPELPDVVRLELFDTEGNPVKAMTGWYFRWGSPLYGPYGTDVLAREALRRKREETPI